MSKWNASKRRKTMQYRGKSARGAQVLLASAVGSALWATQAAYGQAFYWGGSGTPAGAGSSPSGTWAAGSLNWSSDPSGAGAGSFTDVTTTSNNLTFGTALATGSYTVTVSATGGSLIQTATINLTIQ